MRMTGLFVVAVMAAASFSNPGTAQAQSRLSTDIPAEIPPASYTARQYVDSRGCVYVRAGIDGNVTWVPRVARAREHLCGARPTFANAPAPQPAAPRPRVTQITPDPAPVPRAAAPAQRPATTRAPMRTVASIPATRPAPASEPAPQATARAAPQTPRPAPTTVSPKAQAACKGASVLSQRYINNGKTLAVRCGPQTEPHVNIVRRGEAPGPGKNVYRLQPYTDGRAAPGNTRIVPRHVYEGRDDQTLRVPAGYRSAFDDDRLNRKRANQSIDGYRATQLVWTNTVPRRLIDRRSGRDVTAKYPKLIYPHTDMTTQNAVISTKTQSKTQTETARVSTKSVAQSKPQTTSGRYVQVGTFGVPANAERTARQLMGLGLPVRYGRSSKAGQSYRIVLAGPFATGAELSTALSTARRAGFSDAFVR